MSESGRIDAPFKPEQHVGEWVWLWCCDRREWRACLVLSLEPGLTLVRGFAADHDLLGKEVGRVSYVPGDQLEGRPCLPMLRPTAEPGAGLEVAVRLPDGGSLQHVWAEPGDDATRAREAVIAAVMPEREHGHD